MRFRVNMLTAFGCVTLPFQASAAERLYACGDDQIREYRIENGWASEVWRWSASTAKDLPDEYRNGLLDHIDDCKPVKNGRKILATSSTSGVVLIDRRTGRVSFRAKAPMAHSADMLPGGRIAVALSIHKEGDRLEVYDSRRSERPVLTLPLPSGHGAVWDAERNRLYALSHDLIQAFTVGGARRKPTLRETDRWTLPGRKDGHDLSRRSNGRYFVTTDDGVWVFDPASGDFVAFSPLNPKLRVKAVSELDGAIAWVQAEDRWWANGFTVSAGDGSNLQRLEVDQMRLYKVRWIR